MGSSSSDSSLLLWLLGALLSIVTAYAALGWVRHAKYLEGWRRWGGVAAAAALLGSGFTVAAVLGLAGEAFSFPLGFRRLWAVGLWLSAILLALPILGLLAYRRGLMPSLGAAVLLAALGVGIQVGWVMSVGFRPGISWRPEFVALGALAMAVGFGIALSLTFPENDKKQRNEGWKLVAAALMGLAWLAGEALVLAGANLTVQVGSIYRHELSGSMTALVGAGLLPIVLAFVIVDLELRRRHRRSSMRRRRKSSSYRRLEGLPSTPAATAPAAGSGSNPPLTQG